MDTIEAMRTFAAVAQASSFSAAARRLGISKALASKQVALLERRLGVCLLQRTTRAVSLTETGREVFARCLAILGAVEDLESEAASGRAELCGTLRIAGPPVLGEEVLARAVGSFVRRHPAIRVEMALEERFVDLVGEGFDVAIRVGALADSSLVARRIGVQSFVFCATREYLERRATPRHPTELLEHDCIVDAALSPTAQWSLDGARGPRLAIRPRVRASSARAVATLVRAGAGIGLVAESLVRDELASGRLVRLFANARAYERDVWAVFPHPHRAHLPARSSAFVAHLERLLRAETARSTPAASATARRSRASQPARRRST